MYEIFKVSPNLITVPSTDEKKQNNDVDSYIVPYEDFPNDDENVSLNTKKRNSL